MRLTMAGNQLNQLVINEASSTSDLRLEGEAVDRYLFEMSGQMMRCESWTLLQYQALYAEIKPKPLLVAWNCG